MDNNALTQIRDLIARSNRVSIAVSANPTVDQMAGALSLSLTFANQGKSVSVISPTEVLVEHSSLVGIDKVTSSTEGTGGDLVVSFPYRDGEIDKVSYTIEDNFLNIVVKAGEKGLTFSENDIIYKRGSDKPEVVIAVGVPTLAELSSLYSEEVLNAVTLLNIDNATTNEGYGNVVLVSAKFSSLSEQVADLLLNLGMDLDIDIAQNLMLGLISATDNFQNPKTSYLAFEIASILIKRGATRPGSVANIQSAPSQPKFNQAPVQQAQVQPQRRDQQSQRPQPVRTNNQAPQSQQANQPKRDDRRESIREALRQQSRARQNVGGQQSQPMPSMDVASQAPQAQINVSPEPVQPIEPIQDNSENSTQQKPPSDWLTPKVYKGSTSVS